MINRFQLYYGASQSGENTLIIAPGFTGKIGKIHLKEFLMPRRLFILLLFFALALAACKSAGPTGTATVAGPTATLKQPSTLNVPEEAMVPNCTVESYIPTPDPSSIFPPITEEDHYRGSLTATVKIIEYSDFQ